MSKFKRYWAKQFARPTGFGGKIAVFIMNRMNKTMYRAVERRAPDRGEILDIGCGNGYLLQQLRKKTNAVLYGTDISKDMLTAAKKRNAAAVKSGWLKLKNAPADNLPFADGQFDMICTVNTVYFWPDLKAGLLEIFAKLKSGGEFLNVVYAKEWLDKLSYTRYGFAKYAPEELITAAEQCGFAAEYVPIEPGKSYMIRSVKKTENFFN
ncbi:methyltransferase [Clostridia bacterium]|nr:methyltransferase [Clostridia bacterium]